MKQLLLDTHIWLWFCIGDRALKPRFRRLINDHLEANTAYISAISVWETAMLQQKNRLTLSMNIHDWFQHSLQNTPITVISIDSNISIDSVFLPGEFHSDPADRIIIATARAESMHLMTHDKRIIQYAKSGNVNIITA